MAGFNRKSQAYREQTKSVKARLTELQKVRNQAFWKKLAGRKVLSKLKPALQIWGPKGERQKWQKAESTSRGGTKERKEGGEKGSRNWRLVVIPSSYSTK